MQRKTFPCARLCILFAALAHDVALAEESTDPSSTSQPGVVHKVANTVERGAYAAAHGIERGAKAAARGVERGAKAAVNGVERGFKATARVASRVANKVTRSSSSEAPK